MEGTRILNLVKKYKGITPLENRSIKENGKASKSILLMKDVMALFAFFPTVYISVSMDNCK